MKAAALEHYYRNQMEQQARSREWHKNNRDYVVNKRKEDAAILTAVRELGLV